MDPVVLNADVTGAPSVLSYSAPGYIAHTEDFIAPAGGTLPQPWVVFDDTGTGVLGVEDYVDSYFGAYQTTANATNEAQGCGLYWGDFLGIRMNAGGITGGPVVEWGFLYSPVGALPDAASDLVIGLASACNPVSTLPDAIVDSIWVRVQGANLDLLTESDDGTTETSLVDSGVNIAKDKMNVVRFDMRDRSACTIWHADWTGGIYGTWTLLATVDMSTGAMELQPFAVLRTSSVVLDTFTVDYFRIWAEQRAPVV